MKVLTTLYAIILLFIYIRCCPDQPTDIILIIKSSYYLTDYQWGSIISFATKLASVVDIGRSADKSQIAVALYDNLNDPQYPISFDSYGRSSDLSTAIQKLKLLPCGSWCGEQTQKSDSDQIATILSKQTFKRLTKVFIVSSEYIDSYSLQSLMSSLSNVQVQQIIVPQSPGIVTYNQPYYDYYRAYYDQYRRYASRYEQIYPYVNVQVPSDQYPYMEQVQPGYETTSNDNWASSTCFSSIGCQECMNVPSNLPPKIEHSSDGVHETVHSGDTKNSESIIEPKLTSELVTKPSKSETVTEDYEYEITADPPGMKINKTPLLDEVSEKSVSDDDLI